MATGVVDVTLSFLRLRVHDMGHVWPGWRDPVCACVVVRTRSPQSQWSRMRGPSEPGKCPRAKGEDVAVDFLGRGIRLCGCEWARMLQLIRRGRAKVSERFARLGV